MQTTKDKVIISGNGPTVTKAITTAEIVKRKVKVVSLSVMDLIFGLLFIT
jgi:DNA-binding protein